MFGGCRWVFGWDCPKVVVGMTGHSFPLRSQYLLPTDPPNLSWSDGCLEPVEEELVEGEWELQVHGATPDGDEDGWHYAFGWEFNFHAAVTRQDLVRKRIWLRRRHHDVHAGPRREDDGGIAGWIRVILTPEEEGAVLERAGCQSGVVDEVQCVHADMGRLAQVEGKLVCPQPADRDKGSVKDLVYGNIAMVRVLSDSEASGDRQQGSTHQVWDGEEGSAHPMPEALEDLGFVDQAKEAAAAGASAVVLLYSEGHWKSPPSCRNGVDLPAHLHVPVVWVRACDEGHLRPGATCQLSFTRQAHASSVARGSVARSTQFAGSGRKQPTGTHTRKQTTGESGSSKQTTGEWEHTTHTRKQTTGEWEWAAEAGSSSDEEQNVCLEEQGDKQSWLHSSKKAVEGKAAAWLASLASYHAAPLPSAATAPEWAVEDDAADQAGAPRSGEEGGAASSGEEGLVGIGAALASDVLRDLSEVQLMLSDNARFFSSCPEQTLKHYKRCTELCVAGNVTLHDMPAVVQAVAAVASKHDISPSVCGNGFWAQLRVLSCCLKKVKGKLGTIASERQSLLFGTRVKTLLHGPN